MIRGLTNLEYFMIERNLKCKSDEKYFYPKNTSIFINKDFLEFRRYLINNTKFLQMRSEIKENTPPQCCIHLLQKKSPQNILLNPNPTMDLYDSNE
jgi:hypothetical protein